MDKKINGTAAYFSQLGINAVSLCGKIKIKICTKNELDRLTESGSQSAEIFGEILKKYGDDIPFTLPDAELMRLMGAYIDGIAEIIEAHGEYLKVPESSVPLEGALPECSLPSSTLPEKIAAEYTGLTVPEVGELNYLLYRLYLADAVKYNLGRTEKGIEYLNTAYLEMFSEYDRDTFLSGGAVSRRVVK